MKKIFKLMVAAIVLIIITLYAVYKYNPKINNIVNITLLNIQEITQFEIKGNELYMNNLINAKTFDQFVKIIKKNPQITTIVEEHVEGSIHDDTMIKLAYYIREKGLNTKLLSYSDINSGGVDLFLAGVKRTMEKGAHIGVHSWSDGLRDAREFPKDAPDHEQNRKYIEIMLGKDDFYWFTIYAAPADGIYEMSEEDIAGYGLLTEPIITTNLVKTNKIPGILANKVGNFAYGDTDSDTIIVNLQGGPELEFNIDAISEIYATYQELKFATKPLVLNVHQEQTLHPWKFTTKEITFEHAKAYDQLSTKYVADIVKYFKNKGKRVFIVGISFGAFVTQELIANYGNIADGYLIMVGRLNIPKEIWTEFAKGHYVGFEYDKKGKQKIIPFSMAQAGMGGKNAIEDKNMAKLAAGLGYKRYMTLLKNTDLSNVIYAYGKTDEQVGGLNQEEIDFLQSKDVKILTGNGDHSKTIDEFLKEGIEYFSVSL